MKSYHVAGENHVVEMALAWGSLTVKISTLSQEPLPLKLSVSLSMHEPMLSLSPSMHERMLSLSMLVLDPNHPDLAC